MTENERTGILRRLLDPLFVFRRKRLYEAVTIERRTLDYLASIEHEMTDTKQSVRN